MTNEFTHVSTPEMRNAQYRQNIYPYRYPITFDDEVFVRISDFMPEIDDYFWISNYGRAYNSRTGYLVTPNINKNGYVSYWLRRRKGCMGNNGRYDISVLANILVCRAFNGPKPSPVHQTNHKNFIRHINHYSNLEWITPQENLNYSRSAGNYWSGESYSSSKYKPDQVHALCKLMQNGCTDINMLSNTVFGIDPNPSIYALIQDLRTGSNWSHISSQYSIPPIVHRNFVSDNDIHSICKYLQSHPNGPYDTSIVVQSIGIDYHSLKPIEKKRYVSAINQIRNRKAYSRITCLYDF